jgi:hypothetical protein
MVELFNRCIQEKITPNNFYVLTCIKHKIVPASFISKELAYTVLKADNWLNEDLQLTSKSIIFIEEISGYFKKAKKKANNDLMGIDYVENIQKYVELFPDKKLSSGRYARVNPKNLDGAFKWFFETYDYTWETILLATEKYVSEYEMKRFEYMRTSQYFLRKQNLDKSFESELANYCDLVISGAGEIPNYFKETIV